MNTKWIQLALSVAAVQLSWGCSDGGGVGQPSYGGATQVAGSAGAGGNQTGGTTSSDVGATSNFSGSTSAGGSTGFGTSGSTSFGGSF